MSLIAYPGRVRRFLLALVLFGCASTPSPSRCVAGQVSTCPCPGGGSGSQACGPDGVFGVCSCADAGTDGGAPLDAATDTQAPDSSAPAEASIDAAPEASIADVARDVAPPDTSAPADAARCPFGFTADCFGSSVNLGTGVRRPDGTTLHCGACGNTCAAGTFCEVCQCVR